MFPRNLLISLALLVVLTQLGAGHVRAEEPQGVYVVHIQRVISESIIGKAARQDLEQEMKERGLKLEVQQRELRKLKGELDKQGALLSAGALEEKRENLHSKERALTRSLADQREELARQRNTQLKKIVDKIDLVLKELAEKNNYKFVLNYDLSLVVYADQQFDLTDQVIKILDDKHISL